MPKEKKIVRTLVYTVDRTKVTFTLRSATFREIASNGQTMREKRYDLGANSLARLIRLMVKHDYWYDYDYDYVDGFYRFTVRASER